MPALLSNKGNISMALLLVLLCSLSSSMLFFIAFNDTSFTHADCAEEQVFCFLRSETARCGAVLDAIQARHEGFYLPEKTVTIKDSPQQDTYLMQSRLLPAKDYMTGPLLDNRSFIILSLVKTKVSPIHISPVWFWPNSVQGYCERSINQDNGLLSYAYFTDNDQTTNGTMNPFSGTDVLYGPVHSNSDIWIKQAGGGNNNGWPTFYGPVTTSGNIQSYSGTPPYAQVFRAGYWEHTRELEFPDGADGIRAHGTVVGPSAYDPDRIMFVTVSGSAYSSYMGQVYSYGIDTLDVWSGYPPRQGNYLFHNRFTRYDTLWLTGPTGLSAGHSNVVFSTLWIKGRFQGAQTWCSVDTMYISDNCYLANTPLGSCPDGTVGGSYTNQQDLVGLVSEKSILVQYGYYDPSDSTRKHPNCDGDAQGIWIYAALCALGDGYGNPHRDGVFSFEYQHPHPSVPAVTLTGNTWVWDQIDLHRRRYPQNAQSPWPGNIDYPLYNPLWPEGSPFLERGTIHLWGSLAQRRRGYIHRGLADDPEYPNPNQIWNIPADFGGGPSGNSYADPVLNVTYNCQNAQDTSGGGVGYRSDFHYDSRFQIADPPDFPVIHINGAGINYLSQGWCFKRPPRSLTVLD